MNVTIELRHGPQRDQLVSAHHLQKQVDTLHRLAQGASGSDTIALMDTASILTGIQRELPNSGLMADPTYRELYEECISIMQECAGVAKTPIEGWRTYVRNSVQERKRHKVRHPITA